MNEPKRGRVDAIAQAALIYRAAIVLSGMSSSWSFLKLTSLVQAELSLLGLAAPHKAPSSRPRVNAAWDPRDS